MILLYGTQTASVKRVSASSKLMTFQIAERYCTNDQIVRSRASRESIAKGLTSALTFLYWQVKQNPLVRVFKARKYPTWR